MNKSYFDNLYEIYKDDEKYLEKVKETQKMYLYNNEHIFYKFINNNMTHHNFTYQDGLNVDILPFNISKPCSAGGLYFCDIKEAWRWKGYGNKLYKVIVPKYLPIYNEGHKYKAPALYIDGYYDIGSIDYYNLLKNTSLQNNILIIKDINKHENRNDDDFNNILNNIDSNNIYKYYKTNLEYQNHGNYFFVNKYLQYYDLEHYDNETNITNLCEQLFDNKYNLCNVAYSYLSYNKDTFFRFLKDHYFDFVKDKLNKKNNIIDKIKSMFSNNLKQDYDLIKVKHEIKLFFDKIGFNGIEFLKLLKDNDAIISGSFILSFLTNNKFTSDDIDIYVKVANIEDLHPIEQFLKNIKKKSLEYKVKKINESNKSVYILDKTHRVITYKLLKIKNKKNIAKFQLIYILDHPIEHINKSFDFDFCKVMFDGENIITNHLKEILNNQGNISLDYLKSCLNIKSNLAKYRITRTIQRIDKYMKRGFKINNYNEFLKDIIKSILSFTDSL